MPSSNLYPGEMIIDDNWKNKDALLKPVVNGNKMGLGYDPDEVDYIDKGMLAPSDIHVIPRADWSARIQEQEKTKSRTSDILLRANIPSTDQNGDGYCWAYSTGGCMIATRAINNQPYLKLNPHSVAATIKKGANQGGWCGQSARFMRERGIAVMGNGNGEWPEHSRRVKKDEATVEAMARHRIEEDWIDLRRDEWNDDMTFDQIASCLLVNIPCCGDFNWWGHSVMLCDLVELSTNVFGIRMRNSWTDSWGEKGFSILQGSKSIPDGAIAIRSVEGASR